jgi:pimeloyl-ACP methyl ester carboxylesterase
VSYALCAEALALYDVRPHLGSIAAPVLAVWGEYDMVTPEANAAEIAEGVANGTLERVADAAHLAPAEQPAIVAALLTRHFEGAA